jgi:glutamate formiminotransferase
MNKLVECVPNFSEGKEKEKIALIARAIEQRKVKLLGIASDQDHNRTVITFVGEPDEVKEAAFEAIKTASHVIDMSKHKGEHPRLGATDVCPFIPIFASMNDCVQLAHELGEKVGSELMIPVYLYGEAAIIEERRLLSTIRKGEYEGLAEKLKQAEWKPDYGPAQFNPKTGVTVIGARAFLIAFNVNLNTNDVNIAKKIAGKIRESGVIIDGKRVHGSLKCVQALGVMLKDIDAAQVTMNLSNYTITGLDKAFEEVKHEAKNLEYEVTGSEIVGLVPKAALVEAGKRWAEKDGANQSGEEVLIQEAVNRLKLGKSKQFDINTQVLEYVLGD